MSVLGPPPAAIPFDGCRLAELLGALSVAADHTGGLPLESAVGASVVAVRLGRLIGMSEQELAAVYHATIVRFLGCTSTAFETASAALGEEPSVNHAVMMCDWSDPAQVEASLERYFAPHLPAPIRRAAIRKLLELFPALPELVGLHCWQARILATRLPLPAGTIEILSHLHARWDGKFPGPRGTDVALGERVIALSVAAELVRRVAGVHTALTVVESRAGGELDPELCRAAAREAKSLFAGLDGAARWERFLGEEPGEPRRVTAATLPSIASVFADFVDQKSPWLLGHSRQVAGLALLAADALGLPAHERTTLHIAGLLHDIGRVAVPNAIWDKPGALLPGERVRAESHNLHSDTLLGMVPSLHRLRDLATAAHERGDGGGYHRRIDLRDTLRGALAAADTYDALTHERPWRAAHPPRRAAEILLAEAESGKLPRASARAVLDAAGHGKKTAERAYPNGLTQREVLVVRLFARGLSTKSVAEALGISPKTADHHLQHAYDKCGVRSRAALALFALEQGITAE